MKAGRVDFYAIKACVAELSRTHIALATSKGVMFLPDSGGIRNVPLA